jgi:hypothetical protein
MTDSSLSSIFAKRVGPLLLCGVLLLLCGCAASKPPVLKPPDVSLGPVLTVLGVETGSDKVRLVPDTSGQIHALIASDRTDRVYHVTVSENRVSQPAIVRSDASPSRIDGAFDKDGNLHLLLDEEHFRLVDGVWRTSDGAPWAGTGIEPSWAAFVSGAPELVWAFEVDGADLGASMRMDIYGFGGYGGGIIWPWFTRGSRLVLAAESQPDCWNVVALPGRLDSLHSAFAASARGDIHFTYFTCLGGMLRDPIPHYAHLHVGNLAPDPAKDPEAKRLGVGNRTLRLQNVVGGRLPPPNPVTGFSCSPVAVDPETGTVLLGTGLLVSGDMYTDAPAATALAESSGVPVRTVPAGRYSFHALQGGNYRLFSGLQWSAPLALGLPQTAAFWGTPWEAVDLAGTGDGRAFAVWPVPRGIMGRWIAWEARNATAFLPDTPMWPLPDPKQLEPFAPVHIVIAAPERDEGLERLSSVLATDCRNETGHRRTASFDTLMSGISLFPAEPEVARRIVETKADRVLAGQPGTAPEKIECDIAVFDIGTPAAMLYWDVEARLEWTLRARGTTRTVSASATERTFLWPSEEIITRVVEAALRQAGEKTETALRELLAPAAP